MRLRSIAWAGLAGLAVAALVHSGVLVFATLAAVALAALVTISRRRVFRAFTFERTAAQHVVAWGGRLDVTVSFTNAKLLPMVWMHVRDEWPLGIEPHGFSLTPAVQQGHQSLSQTVSLRWYERVRRRYQMHCTQRGLHHFGPTELEAGDPFGIAGVVRRIVEREDVVVLPRVLDVEGFETLTGRPLVEAPADRSLAIDPTALRGMRPYRPGDALRAVNWRATARTGELHTNEFDPTTLAAVKVVLDVGVLEHGWMGTDPDRAELLCVVAASLATAFADRGFGIGLSSNARVTGDWRAVDVEPRDGALDEVLETLGRIVLFSPNDFHGTLDAELDDERAQADCVIVTAAIRPRVRELVARLRAERPTTVVYVGEPSADERPFVDAVVPGDFDWRATDALTFVA
jgi:uncharacterized protein (DUF58 family)